MLMCRVTIAIPAPFMWKTIWHPILTTDNATIYEGFQTIDREISVFQCEDKKDSTKTEKFCAKIALGSYSISVLSVNKYRIV